MKNKYNEHYSIFIFLFSIICFYLFIQLGLFKYIIPNFIIGDYSDIGLIDGDAIIHHHSSSYLSQLLKLKYYDLYLKDFLDFTIIPLNIKILSFFYAFLINGPLAVLFLNIILFLISIFYLYKVSKIISSDSLISNSLFYLSSLILLFFPSYIYIFNSSGKESFMIPLLLIFLFYVINICDHKKYELSLLSIFLIFFTFSLIHILKPHFSYILYISCISLLIFYLVNFKKNKNKIFNLIILIVLMSIIYLIFSFLLQDFLKNFNHTEATTINAYISDRIAGKHGPNIDPYILVFEYHRFIPNILEEKYFEILSLRNHFINYSISVGSDIIIDKDVYPNSILKFLLYSPKLLFNSILSPYPSSNFSNQGLFLAIANIEMIFIYLLFLGLLLNINQLKTYEIFIILICLFACSVLLFVNPNLGTHYRVRLPFIFILSFLGIKSWLVLFFSLNKKKIKNQSKSQSVESKFSFNKLISGGYQNFFFLICFTALILLREIFLIRVIGLNDDLSLYLITISFLGIIANSLNLPLNDILITNRDGKYQKISDKSLQLIILVFLIILIFIIIFSIYSENLLNVLKLTSEVSFPYILTFSSILFSIPLNALSSSYLFIIKKNRISYFLQNIIPLSSLSFIYFYKNNISLDLIYYSISLGVITNALILFLISLKNGLNLKCSVRINNILNLFNNDQFINLLKTTVCFLLINSYVISIIYISSKLSLEQFPVINISLRFLILINAVMASIVSAMILPLFKRNSTLKENSLKLILYLFLIICMITSYLSLVIENLGIFSSFKDYSVIICILKILPLSILLNLFLKYFIHINKLNIFLIASLFYSVFYLIVLIFININSIFVMVEILSYIIIIQMVTLLYFLNFSYKSNLLFCSILLLLFIFNLLDPVIFLLILLLLTFLIFLHTKIKNHFIIEE